MRRWRLTFLLVLAIGAITETAARAASQSAIDHGREITKDNVGPAAAGFKAKTLAPSAETSEIKSGQTPSYATLVPDATTYDGIVVPGPHLLIENITIEYPLDIYTRLPVVMRGVYVHVRAGGHWGIHMRPGSGPLYVLWSQIGGSFMFDGPTFEVQTGLLLRGGAATIYRSHIKLAADAIHADTPNIRVEENLIDSLVAQNGSHNDAIQIAPGVEDVVIRRNRILNQNRQTSCIFNEGSGVTIEDNYLAGGGWVIYGGASSNGHRKDGVGSTRVRVTGNVFGADFFPKAGNFGPVAYWDPANIWADNRFSNGRAIEAQPIAPSAKP